ncbi:pyridoxal phosphate-dependent aminotransferase [Oceanidesulfovibrio marinus]|uniref:Aminotransferase n=2 Tax=Oceanidesulfovibrio marinus TaxID=370038 RepID=A0A6P1ZFT0_9BACT|nr:pyridoxal phosphate-dependent aminotransferase [Oceanidesulfovibrio marinus]
MGFIMERALLDEIKPFYVMDVLERAKAMERDGMDVVHLEVGEPDFDMPEPVRQAAIKALNEGHTHYTHSLGMIELREAIAADYAKRYGVTVDPEHIVVTNGTSPAIFLTFAALLEKGDEVIVSDPHYACYPNFIRLAGGEPRLVPTLEEDGFQFRAAAIRKAVTEKTRAVFLNSPSNPVGTLLPPERMKNVADIGLPVVSDEIYHGLVYGGQRDHTVLEFTKNCFVLNGFSKLYAMTGLRLGYLIAPEVHTRDLQKLCQNMFISPNSVSQWAGIAALTQCEEDVEQMKAIYDERRQYMVARLRDIGLGIAVEPFGAFYVFANAKKFGGDSYALAFDILEHAHVGVTPGTDFGQGGEGFIRFSYANSLENIERGLDRVERYLKTRMG